MTADREVVFETDRLWASQWQLSDADQALRIYGNPQVVKHLSGKADADLQTVQQRLEFLIRRNRRFPAGMGSYPVFEKASGMLVGNAMIKPLPFDDQSLTEDIEIGWHLCESVWGQGYATEFGTKLLQLGFEELNLDPIHAVVGMQNQASAKVCQRLGMQYLGTTTQYYGGQEVHHYSLAASDFNA